MRLVTRLPARPPESPATEHHYGAAEDHRVSAALW